MHWCQQKAAKVSSDARAQRQQGNVLYLGCLTMPRDGQTYVRASVSCNQSVLQDVAEANLPYNQELDF